MRILKLTVGFIFIVFFLWGCCHPPVKEISLAKAQLSEAKEVGAPKYAPEKYKKAEALVAQAEAESKTACRKSWKTVKLAQEAAKEAKEEALKAKSILKDKAARGIIQAQEALKEAEKAEAPKYAPDLYEVAKKALLEAKKAFSEEDYALSSSKAEEAYKLALKAKEAALKVKAELAKGPTTYKVAKGECLWIISGYEIIYNNPLMWPLIYWANKANIADPDLVYPGQVLTIPRNFSEKDKNKAISFAKKRGPWSLFDGR